MKTLFLFVGLSFGHQIAAEEWQIGPIRIGQSLAVIEKVLGVKAVDEQCAVISLRADEPDFPFFAAGFKWIEVSFPNIRASAKVGSIGFGIPADRISSVQKMLISVFGKGKRDEMQQVWLRNNVRYSLSARREMLVVESVNFRCE
jgi:hypothetical protein